MYSLKKFFFQSSGHYLAALFLAAAVAAFRFSTLPDGIDVWYVCYEILSVAGYVTFLVGGLMTVTYFGAFDLFGFVFSPGQKKFKNYADYTQKKTEKRAREGYFFVPYYVVGIVLVLISLLFA